MPLPPYRAERYEIGTARDGRPVALAPMTAAAADILGPATAAIGPWAHYALDGAAMAESFKSTASATVRYQVECDGKLAGVVLIRPVWLAGPYLQLLAVQPAYQGQGIGALLLAWYEAEVRGQARNLWLCVSSFNTEAQRFYLAHGFECIATLEALIRDGDDELLMRKQLPQA
jgi:ribosomal protein S18 acetylase RimI-like enzyme